jgi:hypothetical protein
MTEAANPTKPWRSVRLGLLMFAVLVVCFVAAFMLAWQIIIPALGIDPLKGYTLLSDPVSAVFLVSGVLLFAAVVIYGGAIAGAWIAKRYFTLNEIEPEFLRVLWLPGMRTANARLFRRLFWRQADV